MRIAVVAVLLFAICSLVLSADTLLEKDGSFVSDSLGNSSPAPPSVSEPSWTNQLDVVFPGSKARAAMQGTTNVAVYILGAVKDEGWQHLPEGTTLKDAIEAAGGTQPYASWRGTVIVARCVYEGKRIVRHRVDGALWAEFRLQDGDQIYVLDGR